MCKYNKDHPDAIAARDRVPLIIDSVSPNELVDAVKMAPSLRGMILGYVAELKFLQYLRLQRTITSVTKPDDHDRTSNKADVLFTYQGKRISIQLKSIQTNSIKWDNTKNTLTCDVQNDGSDSRDVILPNGKTVHTTNYKVGDYDILAVPLFPFSNQWDFAFLLNTDCCLCSDCPRTRYSRQQAKYLLAGVEHLDYPLQGKWTSDLFEILGRLRTIHE